LYIHEQFRRWEAKLMTPAQLAELSAWQKHQTPELAALAELLALIEVLTDLGCLELSSQVPPRESETKAIEAFNEAIDRGTTIVAAHFRARGGPGYGAASRS